MLLNVSLILYQKSMGTDVCQTIVVESKFRNNYVIFVRLFDMNGKLKNNISTCTTVFIRVCCIGIQVSGTEYISIFVFFFDDH